MCSSALSSTKLAAFSSSNAALLPAARVKLWVIALDVLTSSSRCLKYVDSSSDLISAWSFLQFENKVMVVMSSVIVSALFMFVI